MESDNQALNLASYVKKLKIRRQDLAKQIEVTPDKKNQLDGLVKNIEEQIASIEKVMDNINQKSIKSTKY